MKQRRRGLWLLFSLLFVINFFAQTGDTLSVKYSVYAVLISKVTDELLKDKKIKILTRGEISGVNILDDSLLLRSDSLGRIGFSRDLKIYAIGLSGFGKRRMRKFCYGIRNLEFIYYFENSICIDSFELVFKKRKRFVLKKEVYERRIKI